MTLSVMTMPKSLYDLYCCDRYDRHANPDGIIELAVAENRLLWDVIDPRVNGHCQFDADNARYQ
jgi:hypothetical protein